MAQDKQVKHEKKGHDQPVTQPDPETLHKTDPQENMKGPISSTMNSAREKIQENDKEVPEGKETENEED